MRGRDFGKPSHRCCYSFCFAVSGLSEREVGEVRGSDGVARGAIVSRGELDLGVANAKNRGGDSIGV